MARKVITSFCLDRELFYKMEDAAYAGGQSKASFISDALEKKLKLLESQKDAVPVFLHIPNRLKDDEEQLRQWLEKKMQAIVEHFKKK